MLDKNDLGKESQSEVLFEQYERRIYSKDSLIPKIKTFNYERKLLMFQKYYLKYFY